MEGPLKRLTLTPSPGVQCNACSVAFPQAAAAFNHLASLANSTQPSATGSRRRSSSSGTAGANPTSTNTIAAATTIAATAPTSSSSSQPLPEQLLRLADASAPVALPPPRSMPCGCLDNRELDKLVGALGRNKATWRRALVLLQWLQEARHTLDDRLCTTVREPPRPGPLHTQHPEWPAGRLSLAADS